jgi:hypothetical protein
MSTVPSGTRFIGISTNVNLTERKSAVLNAETQPYTIEDLAATVGVGSQGPQGVEGPAGPPGPVGPAGLEWQGTWNKNTSYVEDDAVGYGGASYFCILDVPGSILNDNPDVDTTHWALLASQGAIGPQGVQGPTGPQGAAGGAGTLQQTVDNGNTITNGFDIMTVSADTISSFNSLGGLMEISTVPGEVNNPFIKFGLPSSGGKVVFLTSADTQTASRTIKLPDASGTVALQTYKIWRAVINYNSVVNVLVNEIGFTSPVITNPSNGEILITKTGFFTSIDENKLDLITATVNNLGTPYVCTLEKYGFAPNNSLILNVFDMDGTQTSTPACNFTVEIRIYN